MKRWLAREALLGSAAVLASLGTACKPDQSVKAGAPVLTDMFIMSGGGGIHIVSTTTDCVPPPDGGSSGGMDASADDDGGVDGGSGGGGSTGVVAGGPCNPTSDATCRMASIKNWCACNGTDPMESTKGEWSCAPLGPLASVVAIFDRLIDVSMFDPDPAVSTGNSAPNTASIDLPAGSPPATASINYGSGGSTIGLIFPLFGNYSGPNLTITGDPTLPSSTAVTVMLNKTAVRAKDGKTAFTGEGLLEDGTVTFTTGPFAAEIAPPPDQDDGDGGTLPPAPDQSPAVLNFTNVVDYDHIMAHVTLT